MVAVALPFARIANIGAPLLTELYVGALRVIMHGKQLGGIYETESQMFE